MHPVLKNIIPGDSIVLRKIKDNTYTAPFQLLMAQATSLDHYYELQEPYMVQNKIDFYNDLCTDFGIADVAKTRMLSNIIDELYGDLMGFMCSPKVKTGHDLIDKYHLFARFVPLIKE